VFEISKYLIDKLEWVGLGWVGVDWFVCNTKKYQAMRGTTTSILILYANIIILLNYLILFKKICPLKYSISIFTLVNSSQREM
jgi:hypothetical protein